MYIGERREKEFIYMGREKDELRDNILFTDMERKNSWLEREKKIMEIGGKRNMAGGSETKLRQRWEENRYLIPYTFWSRVS